MSAVTYKNDCRGGRARAEGMEESSEPMAAIGQENALPNEFASSSNTDEWR